MILSYEEWNYSDDGGFQHLSFNYFNEKFFH